MTTLYSEVEDAVVTQLIAHFPDMLTTDNCKGSDIDGMFNNVLSTDAGYGCVIDFGFGKQVGEGFAKPRWMWDILGLFFIKFTGDIPETDERLVNIISSLASLFVDNLRLGGLVALVNLVRIEKPEPGSINDVPFYMLAFEIQTLDL